MVVKFRLFHPPDDSNEKSIFSSAAHLTAELWLSVYVLEDANHPLWMDRIHQLKPDFIFSFYYRYLISNKILSLVPICSFNVNSSLLQRYRGLAPINWVFTHGERQTGVTLYKVINLSDAGDFIGQLEIKISEADTALTLHKKY